MTHFFRSFFLCIVLIFVGCGFFWYSNNVGFSYYLAIESRTRMSPDLVPSQEMVEITSIGHDHSYADGLWISLVQYIASNMNQDAYLEFSTTMFDTLSGVYPEFEPTYEWVLLLLPIPQTSSLEYSDTEKANMQEPLRIAEKGMDLFCDADKVRAIKDAPISPELWKNTALRNPCKYGMIPYLIAFYGGKLGDNASIANEYYKVAGMQDDVAAIAQVLAVLANAPADDPRSTAETFALLGIGAYDTEPYACHDLGNTILEGLGSPTLSDTFISTLENGESHIENNQQSDVKGVFNCYAMIERALRYTYLAYIMQKAEPYPNLIDADMLLDHHIISHIPLAKFDEGMTFQKVNGTWSYREKPQPKTE